MAVQINGTSGISGVDGSASTPALQGSDSNTGISFGTDEVSINTGGTTRAMVNSSGRLGIGTTSPSSLLHLEGSAPTLSLKHTATGSQGVVRWLDSAGTVKSQIASYFNVADAGNIEFCTNGTGTDMVLDSFGRLLVGTTTSRGTSSPAVLQIAGGNGSTSFNKVAIVSGNNEDAGGLILSATSTNSLALQVDPDNLRASTDFKIEIDGAQKLRIDNAGRIISSFLYDNTSATGRTVLVQSSGELVASTSSLRFKTDIEPIEDSYSTAILDIQPVWYRSTCEADNPDWGWWGFIAEDVAKVDPRLVIWTTDEIITDESGEQKTLPLAEPVADAVAYDRFVPHLLNLIKRQKEQLETLGTTVTTQAATIAALDARLAALEGGN